MAKGPKFRKDGGLSMRGHGEGSKASRFTHGDRRVRSGRPKGSRDEKSEVLAVRDMPVRIEEKDKDGVFKGYRTVSTRQGIYERQRNKALNGDQRSSEFLDRKFSQYEPIPLEPDLTQHLLREDQAILDFWRSQGRLPPSSPIALAPPSDDRATDTSEGPGERDDEDGIT